MTKRDVFLTLKQIQKYKDDRFLEFEIWNLKKSAIKICEANQE
jgi:hypothetical protein